MPDATRKEYGLLHIYWLLLFYIVAALYGGSFPWKSKIRKWRILK